MKKLVAITLLLCVTYGPLYQLGFTAYYILNLEQIIDRFCVNKDQTITKCNARCYLSEQLSIVDSPEEHREAKGIATILVLFPLYFELLKTDWHLFSTACENSVSGYNAEHYHSLTLKVPIPPPKV